MFSEQESKSKMETSYVPGASYVKIFGPAWVTTDGFVTLVREVC